MVMLDPPDHTAFRRLVGRGFTPRHVTEIEPAVRAFVVERLERLRAAGSGDVVAELFKPLPSFVVAYYLGVPEADWPRFDGWTEGIVAANAAGRPAAGGRHGRRAVRATSASSSSRSGPSPGDDTISALVADRRGRRLDHAGPRLRLHDGHRRQRHHHGHARRGRRAAHPLPRPAGPAARRPGAARRRHRGAAAALLAGAGPGPHADP